ncbi:hypothetical protein EIP91_000692 [Steccherinum ochraceum]|uniref:Uncharacterized protein n=1 Tax=Steccherinum ochraceum TaxID=92696 RepID=A0A4R0RJC4_9APHY|nr:hypothetical protein EIP91_000692 [Steccherinum ochraceum]
MPSQAGRTLIGCAVQKQTELDMGVIMLGYRGSTIDTSPSVGNAPCIYDRSLWQDEVLTEILVLIFTHLVKSNKANPEYGSRSSSHNHDTSLRLSHICQRWRDVVLRMPEMWTQVDLLKPDFAKLCLGRSGHHMKINVHAYVNPEAPPTSSKGVRASVAPCLSDLLEGHFHQVSDVHIDENERTGHHLILALLAAFNRYPTAFSKVLRLHLRYTAFLPDELPGPVRLHPKFQLQSLSHLVLAMIPLQLSSHRPKPSFPNLFRLDIYVPLEWTCLTLLPVLANSPTLKWLRITCDFLNRNNEEQLLTDLQGYVQVKRHLTLPNLNSLALLAPPSSVTSALLNLIDEAAPALDHIYFDGGDVEDLTDFVCAEAAMCRPLMRVARCACALNLMLSTTVDEDCAQSSLIWLCKRTANISGGADECCCMELSAQRYSNRSESPTTVVANFLCSLAYNPVLRTIPTRITHLLLSAQDLLSATSSTYYVTTRSQLTWSAFLEHLTHLIVLCITDVDLSAFPSPPCKLQYALEGLLSNPRFPSTLERLLIRFADIPEAETLTMATLRPAYDTHWVTAAVLQSSGVIKEVALEDVPRRVREDKTWWKWHDNLQVSVARHSEQLVTSAV